MSGLTFRIQREPFDDEGPQCSRFLQYGHLKPRAATRFTNLIPISAVEVQKKAKNDSVIMALFLGMLGRELLRRYLQVI